MSGPSGGKTVTYETAAVEKKPIIVKVSPDFREANEETIIPAAANRGLSLAVFPSRSFSLR